MVITKKVLLNTCSYENEKEEILVHKLCSLLEIGINSDFNSNNNSTWLNYLFILDDIAQELKEKISK